MTKRQLIDEIVSMNQTATPGFLAKFDDTDLNEYLRHLQRAKTPRLSGDPRRYDRYFRGVSAVAVIASPAAVAVAEMPDAPSHVEAELDEDFDTTFLAEDACLKAAPAVPAVTAKTDAAPANPTPVAATVCAEDDCFAGVSSEADSFASQDAEDDDCLREAINEEEDAQALPFDLNAASEAIFRDSVEIEQEAPTPASSTKIGQWRTDKPAAAAQAEEAEEQSWLF